VLQTAPHIIYKEGTIREVLWGCRGGRV